MDLGLRDKKVLVTAASRGLGYACAEMLVREGANVIISSRSREALEKAAARLRKVNPHVEVYYHPADLTRKDDVDRLFDFVEEVFGGLEILVYSTGGPKPGRFMELDDEDWEEAARLVGLSAVWVARRAARLMMRQGWGRMVFIGSITLIKPYLNLATSSIMRMPLLGLVRTLALELAPHGITVNAVLPSLVLTDRVLQLARRKAEEEGISMEEALQKMAYEIPVGRAAEPEELAALVAFLASEPAGFITGTAIPFDGGRSLR